MKDNIDNYDAFDNMENEIEKAISPVEVYVNYSAYDHHENENEEYTVVDNLHEIPIKGKVKVIQTEPLLWKGDTSLSIEKGQPYESEILESPTYLDLCVECNKQIIANKNYQWTVFEGIRTVKIENGVTYIELSCGS